MDIQTLTLFLRLSESLHFGKTGELLHMSPSAVSRAIKRIEDELGQLLFERDNRTVRLTEAGRQFQHYAKQATLDWHQIQEQLKSDAKTLQGEVSVYCSVTAAYSLLASMLEPFRQRYPEVDIKLHTGDQADAIDRVRSGQEDVVIAARPDKLPSQLRFQTLTHSPLLFIYPAMPCAVSTEVESYNDNMRAMPWSALPFIFAERGVARNRLDQWFKQRTVKPNIYAKVSGNEAIVSMVALGFGVGLVPELVLTNSPMKERVRVLDVQPPLTPFAVGICSLARRLNNPQVRAFWDCAKASYQTAF